MYAIIDQLKNGDQFENHFNTAEEALRHAECEWARMSDYDKNRREYYWVVCADLDDDDCIDMNTATIVKEFK